MGKTQEKIINRKRRHLRIRATISGTNDIPRLVVFKSNKFIYGQLIDDTVGKTLAASSDVDDANGTKLEKASKAGKKIADLAKEKDIKACVFDRNGYKYIGRLKAFADGARENGLKF